MAAKMKTRINIKEYTSLHISQRHEEPFTLNLEGRLPLAESDSCLLNRMEAEEPSLTRKILEMIESQSKKGSSKGQFKIQGVKVYFEKKDIIAFSSLSEDKLNVHSTSMDWHVTAHYCRLTTVTLSPLSCWKQTMRNPSRKCLVRSAKNSKNSPLREGLFIFKSIF